MADKNDLISSLVQKLSKEHEGDRGMLRPSMYRGAPGKLSIMLEAMSNLMPMPDNPENFRSGKRPLGTGIGSAGADKMEEAKPASNYEDKEWEDDEEYGNAVGEITNASTAEGMDRWNRNTPQDPSDPKTGAVRWKINSPEEPDTSHHGMLEKLIQMLMKKKPQKKLNGTGGAWIG